MMSSETTIEMPMRMNALGYSMEEISPIPNPAHVDWVSSDTRTKELEMVQALRNGDEAAFGSLIERYHGQLIRLARAFVSSQAIAEEVVQETWLAVLQGIDRFEARSSLKTWIFPILTNRAKTKGQRENRYVSFTDPAGPNNPENDVAIQPEWFHTSLVL